MNYFDTLEKRRRHVNIYNDKVPDKKHIDNALWKAWKTTPGKNSAIAYKIHVWGPDKEIHKEAIHSLCVKSHKRAEDRAVERGFADETQSGEENPFYEHIKKNPYLFTIHQRVAKPNPFYESKIKTGHFFDQGYEDYMPKIVDSVAVEVGLYAANLGYYLLEEGLDISYNSCFVRDIDTWHKRGITQVKHRPLLMMSCGYAEIYRWQKLEAWGKSHMDYKPEMDEIVEWM